MSPASPIRASAMLFIAKNFVYLQATLLVGWLIFRWCLLKRPQRHIGDLPFVVLSLLNLALFFCPIFAILHAVLLILPVAVSRNRQQLLVTMLVGTLGIPAMPTHLIVGGIDLFSWSLQTTYGLGGLIALLATRQGRDSEPYSLNVPLALFLTLMICIASRETNVTNWMRQAGGDPLRLRSSNIRHRSVPALECGTSDVLGYARRSGLHDLYYHDLRIPRSLAPIC